MWFKAVSKYRRLIEKLKSFGIKGKLLHWLGNFLTSRTMKVGLRGTFSQLLSLFRTVLTKDNHVMHRLFAT